MQNALFVVPTKKYLLETSQPYQKWQIPQQWKLLGATVLESHLKGEIDETGSIEEA
jgi:hypothetical protein